MAKMNFGRVPRAIEQLMKHREWCGPCAEFITDFRRMLTVTKSIILKPGRTAHVVGSRSASASLDVRYTNQLEQQLLQRHHMRKRYLRLVFDLPSLL